MSEKYARVKHHGTAFAAIVHDDMVELFEEGEPLTRGTAVGSVPVAQVQWLSPVQPRTILCVGRNYRAHAAELHNPVPLEPLFFLKPTSALVGHQDVILRPTWVGRVDYEGELVLVLGKTVRHVTSTQEALDAIFGLTIGNDVTARDLQRSDGQWTRAKGFDTFAPVGPWIVRDNQSQSRRITTRVNGVIRQDGSTDDLIFSCDRLIMEASRFMTLYPGDLIFTGTPAGIGPVESGDEVDISIQGIGTLSNCVKNGD
ncbi:MAG: 2-hydroxyhepta-2,4-diene-1,7-dioate isomerase [Sulfobacillus acidophilus]|uniref:2-hydroxyhepta-2,4-diene-1,7-dioate isomerase n=1 Tax=Sulfobacillus acidophilus TaxID=53633 RepID=A0A2T2WHL5_9FIRM|nr:MAG: 2-hydroxyhepta-2,4-diene-1,7-dioate isomerase [Sulfobacillus acidophilus]